MNDFVVQIGSADKGRTFVRVTHVPTNKERIVVGLGDADPADVEKRLIGELTRELDAEKGVGTHR